MPFKHLSQSIGFFYILALSGCGNHHRQDIPHYQRFLLVQVEQPAQGCKDVTPCATVVLALDTKTGQVCRAAALHGENYPLCLRLYESYPDDRAEIDRLEDQIKADEVSDWDVVSNASRKRK
jgi:hypothetical protein